MKKYLLVLLGLFVLTTTTYSQELTEKEKARPLIPQHYYKIFFLST